MLYGLVQMAVTVSAHFVMMWLLIVFYVIVIATTHHLLPNLYLMRQTLPHYVGLPFQIIMELIYISIPKREAVPMFQTLGVLCLHRPMYIQPDYLKEVRIIWLSQHVFTTMYSVCYAAYWIIIIIIIAVNAGKPSRPTLTFNQSSSPPTICYNTYTPSITSFIWNQHYWVCKWPISQQRNRKH